MSLRGRCEWMFGLLFACLVTTEACTFALNHERQCSHDTDCKRFGTSAVCVQGACHDSSATGGGGGGDQTKETSVEGSTDPGWSCLGKVLWPSKQASSIKIAMSFFDFVEQTPVTTDFTVRACSKMDILCANPIGPAVAPDATGIASITVPSGFDGYAEIVGSIAAGAETPKYVPSLVFFNPPPIEDTNNTMTAMFSPEALDVLAESNGNTIDPTLGSVFFGTIDCNGKLGAGVSVEPDRTVEATRRFYYIDGLPNFAAVATDAAGYGGLINLPSGTIRLYAKLAATGQPIATVSVFIRAGHISQVDVIPAP
ncbi:MAG TPA: hypothetical protein VKP30_27950 [Polyangiaceae bacterium]|nr:hypothetical protein [Polyangiaceae bacterium]